MCSPWSTLVRRSFRRLALGPLLDAIELESPETLIDLHPIVHGLQFLRVETIHAALAVPADGHDPHPAQYAEVLRHGRLGNPESLNELPDRVGPAAPEHVDD